MADMTPYQEFAAWAVGISTGLGAVAVGFSKVLRSLSSDRQAVLAEAKSEALYTLLLKENVRFDERNKDLEKKNDAMLERINTLEVVHAELTAAKSENKTLKDIIQRKDDQLRALFRQHQKDREDWDNRFKEVKNENAKLRIQMEAIETNLLVGNNTIPYPAATPERRIDDHHPKEPLTFSGENDE